MTIHSEDIRKEEILNRKWRFSKQKPSSFPPGILVTGSNSFIGCHVVHALVNQFKGDIHLLLRAPSEKEAITKMQIAFTQWGLDVFNNERFIIHLGDVCENHLGLTEEEYLKLSREVGQVIHLAMTPMYHLPYHHFQRIWVPELERMIRFCGETKYPKFLHYASSFNANFFQSDDDFYAVNTNAWQSGYAGFKWVSNQALQNAMYQGLETCIYDIPLVLGSEKNGICPLHYSIWLILDIFLKTGYYFPFTFRIIPVDILAEIMVCNVSRVLEDKPSHFVRPMLSDPVTDHLFERLAATLLSLKKADLETVRRVCPNKLRFDFMMPSNFYELLFKVNDLPAIFPEGYEINNLPMTPMVFISNLNRIMSVKHEMINV